MGRPVALLPDELSEQTAWVPAGASIVGMRHTGCEDRDRALHDGLQEEPIASYGELEQDEVQSNLANSSVAPGVQQGS